MSKLWNYRKTLSDFPITPQDEAIFKNFTLKFEDKKSITDKTTENLNRINTQHLLDELDALKSKGPQERGYGFEVWLNELFKTFNLSPREPFKINGEQIDGSFQLNHNTYLIEAKWHGVKTGNRDLHVFQGKIESKNKMDKRDVCQLGRIYKGWVECMGKREECDMCQWARPVSYAEK
ncbi:hypothetical protein AB6U14_28250 [Klebsiella pneumoniae]